MLAVEYGIDLVKSAADEPQIGGLNRFSKSLEFLRKNITGRAIAGPYPKALTITPPESVTLAANSATLPFRDTPAVVGGALGGILALRLANKLAKKPTLSRGIAAAVGGSLAGAGLGSRYF